MFEDASGRDLVAVRALVPSGRHAQPDRQSTCTIQEAQRIHARDRAIGAADAVGKPQAADAHPACLRPGRQPTASDIAYGGVEGASVEDGVIHVRKRRHVRALSATSPSGRSLSLNRGFSAPITLSVEQTPDERVFLARHDSDPFSRWQAFNSLLTDALMAASRQCRGGKPPAFAGRAGRACRRDRRQRDARAGLPGAGAGAARRGRHRPRASAPTSTPTRSSPRREALADGDRRGQCRSCSSASTTRSPATTRSARTRRAPAGGRCATSLLDYLAPAAGRRRAGRQAFRRRPPT